MTDAAADETPPPLPVLIATREDFEGLDIATVVSGAPMDDVWFLARAFQNASQTAHDAKRDGPARAFRLISTLLAMPLRPDDPAGPFGARQAALDRSHIASDFRGEQSRVLADVASGVADSSIQARLADIAWENDHGLTHAGRVAIDAYVIRIEQSLAAEPEHELGLPSGLVDRMHRAVQIAARLHGRRKMPPALARTFSQVMDHARATLDFGAYDRLARMGLRHQLATYADLGPDAEASASMSRTIGAAGP